MAFKCAQRWRAQRHRVWLILLKQGLSEMNDVLLQGAAWRVQSDYQLWPGLPAERIPEGPMGYRMGRQQLDRHLSCALLLRSQNSRGGPSKSTIHTN
jgi:hypothetical protein